MKKTIFSAFVILLASILLSSCYTTSLYIGDVKPNEPLVKVNKVWNHHLIAGLVPLENTKMKTEEFVAGRPNYVVKTNTSFLNALVSGITYGIYTPTQTTYYILLDEIEK